MSARIVTYEPRTPEESDRHFQAALTAGLSLIARASDPADEAASLRHELQRLVK